MQSSAENPLEIGEKVREARKRAGLTLRELASSAQISASMLSQIENGRTNASVQTLYNIASLLDVSMDYFFSGSEGQPRSLFGDSDFVDLTASEARQAQLASMVMPKPASTEPLVLRPAERPQIELNGGVFWSRLTAEDEQDAIFMEVVYEPGASSGMQLSHHRGREFGIILEGELYLQLGFDEHILKQGDTIIFNSEIPHRLSNQGQVPMRALWIIIDRTS